MSDPNNELPAVTLVRIEGKLDLLHVAIQWATTRGEDHEARIRALEQRPGGITPKAFLSTLVGIGSVCGSVGALVVLLAR